MKNKIKKVVGTHKIKKKRHVILSLVIISAGILGFSYFFDTYSDIMGSEISLEKASKISLDDPVIINFSSPVIESFYRGKLAISPKKDFREVWNEKRTRLSVYPDKLWKAGTDYVIDLPRGTNIFLASNKPQRFGFSTITYPKVADNYPQDAAEDVVIGIEDPIRVVFDKPTLGFDVKFVSDPEKTLVVEGDPDRKSFKILPEEKFDDGSSYSIKVYVKYGKEASSSYRLIKQFSFNTLPPSPSDWDKDFSVRLEQAKRFTKAKISTGRYIDINLKAQVMSLFQDGKIVDSFLVSSGKSGMGTPPGEHQIYNKNPRTWSRQYGLYMPYWMAITPDGKYGIHELPEWPGGYKEGANHLGIPVSHGCVRLGVGPAKRVYDFAEVGTKVIVY